MPAIIPSLCNKEERAILEKTPLVELVGDKQKKQIKSFLKIRKAILKNEEPYQILLLEQVPQSYAPVKAAYRAISLVVHPDKCTWMGPLLREQGEIIFKYVSESHELSLIHI